MRVSCAPINWMEGRCTNWSEPTVNAQRAIDTTPNDRRSRAETVGLALGVARTSGKPTKLVKPRFGSLESGRQVALGRSNCDTCDRFSSCAASATCTKM